MNLKILSFDFAGESDSKVQVDEVRKALCSGTHAVVCAQNAELGEAWPRLLQPLGMQMYAHGEYSVGSDTPTRGCILAWSSDALQCIDNPSWHMLSGREIALHAHFCLAKAEHAKLHVLCASLSASERWQEQQASVLKHIADKITCCGEGNVVLCGSLHDCKQVLVDAGFEGKSGTAMLLRSSCRVEQLGVTARDCWTEAKLRIDLEDSIAV